jgi:hypothetical protein
VMYNTGQREWTYLHGALPEAPQTVLNYMESSGLSYPVMGYDNLDPRLLNPDTDAPFLPLPANEAKDGPVCLVTKSEQVQGMLMDDLMIAAELVTGSIDADPCADLFDEDQLLDDVIPTADGGTELLDNMATSPPRTPTKNLVVETKTNNCEPNVPFKCPYDHSDFRQLIAESDSRYCCNGNDYDGVHCANAVCNRLFVQHCPKGDTKCFRPTDKHPLYACENRRDKCPFAICFHCHTNLLLSNVSK